MMFLTEEAYRPSTVLVGLLYAELNRFVTREAKERMEVFTREQIRYGLAATFWAIRERRILDNKEDDLWVVDESTVRPEILNEMKRRIDIHASADYNNPDFRRRLADEIYCWYYRQREEAARQGLKLDEKNRIIISRKNLIKV